MKTHGLARAIYVILISALFITPMPFLFAQAHSSNLTLLANINDYAAQGYSDCWGYAANGREYAFLNVANGVSIIDVTVPANAVEVAFIPGTTSDVKDVKTFQNYAYIVSDNHNKPHQPDEEEVGMQIVDLSDLPTSAAVINVYTEFDFSHNIFIDEPNAMLYAQDIVDGIVVRAISLADPENPVTVSSFGTECHDIFARNNIVYVAEASQASVGIFDLSTPSEPVLLKRFSVPGNAEFTHSVWLSDDSRYLMTTEEEDFKTLKIFDIQDLNNVKLLDQYIGPSDRMHNIYVKGDYCYLGHFALGLKVINIADPKNIFEQGYYDTSPATTGNLGAFGTFAGLPSGNILVSDKEEGLFVFTFDGNTPNDVSVSAVPNNPPVIIPRNGAFFDYTVNLTNHSGEGKTVQIWNEIELPSGDSAGPTFGPTSRSLAPGQVLILNLTMEVPRRPPPAQYNFVFKAGSFPSTPISIDSFPFTKTAAPLHETGISQHARERAAEFIHEDDSDAQTLPTQFSLEQNYPNPFNPNTDITYSLPVLSHVRIVVYDALGRTVRELVNETSEAGIHTVSWNGKNDFGQQVTSGMYFYRIIAGTFTDSRKMTLLQ